jgi:hypothetical protein
MLAAWWCFFCLADSKLHSVPNCRGEGGEESEEPFRTEDFRFHVLQSFLKVDSARRIKMIFYDGIDL